jgi:hypothetical protein
VVLAMPARPAWRNDDRAEPCGILSRTFIHDIGDPEYPPVGHRRRRGPDTRALVARLSWNRGRLNLVQDERQTEMPV